MSKTIPQVAIASGQKSWTSLKRYSHIRQAGDKYAGWKWFAVVNAPDESRPSDGGRAQNAEHGGLSCRRDA
jgi:hypothetical protein